MIGANEVPIQAECSLADCPPVQAICITDLAVATNAFAGGGWTYVVDPAVPLPRLIISEFMAANNLKP